MDGPNYEQLFMTCQCLNPQANLKYIVNYLRFYKSSDAYQAYLKHYVPMLARPEFEAEFDEFVKDLENEELAKELKASLKALKTPAKEEPKVEEKVEKAKEEPKAEEKKEEKKHGHKK
jgi:hypothetical protein